VGKFLVQEKKSVLVELGWVCREVGCKFWCFSWLALWASAGWLERTVDSFVLKNLVECVGILADFGRFVCAVFQLNGCFVLWFLELIGH